MTRAVSSRSVMRRAFALLWVLLLTSCAPLVRPEQITREREITLSSENSVGQTVTAPHGGLIALDIFLGSDASADGTATLRIFARTEPTVQDSRAADPLASVTIPTAGTSAGPRHFELPHALPSHGRSFYIEMLRPRGPPIGVGVVAASSSSNGSAYANNKPIEEQVALQMQFDPAHAAVATLLATLDWLPVLAAAAALLLVPGSALLRLLWPDHTAHSWLDQLALSAATGAALYPPLLAWADLFQAHLTSAVFFLPIAAGAAIHLVLTLRRRPIRFTPRRPTAFDLAIVLVLAALFVTRALPIATLSLPLWGDAIHHTAIAQLIADHGGYFSSWQPYADAQTFTYHPGFHTYLAGLMSLTRFEGAHTALLGGQIMNMLAVVAVAPLASRLGHNRWAGLAAVAVAAFLLDVPQIYSNWSRWTQLAGQMILPAAMLAAWSFLRRPHLRSGSLAALLAAGLALTHYRIIILWALFVALVWAGDAVRLRIRWRPTLRHAAALVALGAGVALLCAPWALRTYQSELARSLRTKLATPAAAVSEAVRSYNEASGGPTSYVPLAFWLLAAGVAVYNATRRRRSGLVIAGWTGAVWLATNPGMLGLPGAGILSNFAINIAAYLPVAALIGSAAPPMPTQPSRASVASGIGLAAAACAAAFGLAVRPADIQPGPHSMADAADVRAAHWVRANLADDALIAVNGFVPTPGGYVAGTDGGWWLRVLSGRRTTIPPMQSQAETQPTPNELERIRTFASLTDGSVPADEAVRRLRTLGVTHVFVGQIQGTSNHPPGGLTVAALDVLPAARAIYREDRVGIYDIR